MSWVIGLALALAAAAAAIFVFRRWQGWSAPSTDVLAAQTFGRILQGERVEALAEMRRLYQSTQQNVGVGVALGVLLRDLGKCQAAIRTHRSLTARNGLDPDTKALVYAELAADYLASGLLGRAREAADRALELKPDESLAARVGERVYIQLQDWEGAAKLVRAHAAAAGLDAGPRLGLLYCEQAAARQAEGDEDGALAAYKKATSADKHCTPAYLAIAEHWRRVGKPAKALSALQKHKDRFAEREWLWLEAMLGVCLDLGDHGPFLEAVHARLEAAPDDWRARAALAQFLGETGEWEEAADALTACLQQSPRTLRLHRLFWDLIFRGQNRDTLLARYRDAIETQLADSALYVCENCGARTQRLVWSCPSCHGAYSFTERKL